MSQCTELGLLCTPQYIPDNAFPRASLPWSCKVGILQDVEGELNEGEPDRHCAVRIYIPTWRRLPKARAARYQVLVGRGTPLRPMAEVRLVRFYLEEYAKMAHVRQWENKLVVACVPRLDGMWQQAISVEQTEAITTKAGIGRAYNWSR